MAPWKQFFGTLWALSFCIPVHKWRQWVRDEKLFGYGDKLRALRKTFPDLDWKHFRLAKGGGSLAFIVDTRVFKIRKFHKRDEAFNRFTREKRITDAIASVLPVRVPHIEIYKIGEYVVYATEFIPGRVLLDLPMKKVLAHREEIGKKLGEIIYKMFNARLPELDDMRPANGDPNDTGLVHGDMCSNILVDPQTMQITGIIDWEYASFDSLKREFFGIFRVRKKMRLTDIAPIAMWEYYQLRDAHVPGRKGNKSVSTQGKKNEKK